MIKQKHMAQTEQMLRASEQTNENMALYGAYAVVTGLVFEVLIAYFHSGSETWLNHWGSFASNALVALGVAAEVLFGFRARMVSDELSRRSEEKLSAANERASVADEKAAAAQLEIARLTAPRSLSNEQISRIKNLLKEFDGQVYRGMFVPSAHDWPLLWQQLKIVLSTAGWENDWKIPYNLGFGTHDAGPIDSYDPGISLILNHKTSDKIVLKAYTAANALSEALAKEGLLAKVYAGNGMVGIHQDASILTIIIGKKSTL